MFQVTIWSIPPLLALLVCVGAFRRIRERQRVPGMHALLVLLGSVMFWAAAQFTASLLTSLDAKLTIWQLAYLGITMAPVAWFVFALTYTRRQMYPSRKTLRAVLVVPVVTVLLVMTNEWHQLMWTQVHPTSSPGFVGFTVERGPWFYAFCFYSYALIFTATVVLAYGVSHTTGQLKPVLSVVAAPAVVSATSLFYLSPLNPSPWFDLTTTGFAAAVIIFENGLLRFGLSDSRPVVRDRVVEKLRDGVAVVNHRGQIMDVNTSALALFRAQRYQAFNNSICSFITTVELSDLVGRIDRSLEVTIHDRAYDVSSSLLDTTDQHSDVVLVFRDITARRQAERDLRDTKEELNRLAHTDSLTTLHNRRYFMARLQEEVERVRRHGSSVSVLVFDLDHFKRINDTWGHETGDEVLRAVAAASMEVKRITDVAARIGGEEFALLLPETRRDGALQLAHRLRETVERVAISRADDTMVVVTASVGVATATQNDRHVDSLLRDADEALYRAKNLGRNRVCYAG